MRVSPSLGSESWVEDEKRRRKSLCQKSLTVMRGEVGKLFGQVDIRAEAFSEHFDQFEAHVAVAVGNFEADKAFSCQGLLEVLAQPFDVLVLHDKNNVGPFNVRFADSYTRFA